MLEQKPKKSKVCVIS